MFILDWLLANLVEITAAFGAGYAFALAVVKLTPTKKDDEALEAIHARVVELSRVVPILAGAVPILKAAIGSPAAKAVEKPKA